MGIRFLNLDNTPILLHVLVQICLIRSENCRFTSSLSNYMAIDVHRFLNFLLGSWHNQYLIFRWITREVVGFIPATSCIRVLLTTADDVVNLLTRNIYLVVVSVSTQLKSNVFIKQIILIKIPRHWTKWWPLRASTSTCEHYILVCKVTRRTTDTNICRGGRSKRVSKAALP